MAWVGINLDLTERKRMELELKEAKESAERARRAKERFFTNISHELRTPLALILGPTRQLMSKNNSPDERHELELIERNAQIVLKHVNDLLDLSRLEIGEQEITYQRFDLTKLLRLLASLFERAAEEKQTSFALTLPDYLQIEADREKIQRIILNLLSNAFKFTPIGGSIELSAEGRDGSVAIHVKDTGPGIPITERQRVFEPFQRVEDSTSKSGGTGLGLAIVREFVNLHKGTIEIEGAEGKGADFSLLIPAKAPEGIHVEAADESPLEKGQFAPYLTAPSSHAGTVKEAEGQGPLVLLVEDNPDMNAFAASILRKEYRVIQAYNGAEALDVMESQSPDLIVTDMMMPVMSGEELVQKLRVEKGLESTPILILTAKEDEELKVKMLRTGAQEYLSKPFSEENLLARAKALVDQKKRAERTLQETYRLLKAVSDSVTDAVFVKDKDGRYLMMNPAGAARFGEDPDSIVGKTDKDIVGEEEATEILNMDQAVMSEKTTKTYEMVFRTDSGPRVHLVTKAPYLDADGTVKGILGIAHDVTLRKEAEEELRHAKEEAERQAKAKDRFLAVLSHELRTPLTPIQLAIDALEKSKRFPGAEQFTAVIRRNLEAEKRLVDDLLDLTRIAAGKVDIKREVVDIHKLVRTLIKDCCEKDLEENEIAVSIRLQAKECEIWGDEIKLKQIFWNLVQNAIKFTPKGGRIDVISEDTETGIRLSVKDSGIGINPDAMRRIFNPFEQAEEGIIRKFGGLGLGLAISKSLSELHNGNLTAMSEGEGKGATFSLELPSIRHAQSSHKVSACAPQQKAAGAGSLRVLLVEDHPDTRMLLTLQLEDFGLTVASAGSVEEAILVADKEHFDILVSDLGLPDGSGHDIIRRLKATKGIRGIAVTGFGMSEDELKSKEAGFEVHMTKPVDMDLLYEKICQMTSA